ncbi:ParB/RepB/Spo0J family partition protein [Nannocystis bainbridge]|uniref:ParB/RepB/Spo0J family partition protein n=1 Tax=Nannocystis bainbridge TaxID=2995303 RepID=A0ABT5E1B9_9BACT|nr:ParB/RepB/Spo0J family partition protein [Nannocystis bainbridge]MDC0719629.1 ParB/RepB/Spo0J family partition protein [Nannocystis bainbridge]
MNLPKRPPALGRGLGALIPQAPAPASADAAASPVPTPGGPALRILPIEQIAANPDQPRKQFEPVLLRELADSLKRHGLLQPVVVTPNPGLHGHYILVAGERRWRAAQLAGLHELPAVIRDTPESDRLELAVLENLQRLDLSPIEEAQAFRQLIDVRGFTQDQLAERLSKDRSTVANSLRLLRLPSKVQDLVQDGRLSMGHARALLALENAADMLALAYEAIEKGLSVRAVERAVRERLRPSEPEAEPDPETHKRAVIVRDLEERLRRSLGVQVAVRSDSKKKGAGTIEVPYGSLDELDRLLEHFLGERRDDET